MSRVCLNYAATCPPGKWRWVDHITGTKRIFASWSPGALVTAVEDFLKANPSAPQMTRDQVEEMICVDSDYGEPYCLGRKANPFGILSLQTLRNFSRTVSNWLVGGGELAPMPEVEARAKVCSECPRNVAISGCADCLTESLTKDIVDSMLVEERRTTVHAELMSCQQCGCRTALKIQLPKEAFADDKFAYPSWCWMNKL